MANIAPGRVGIVGLSALAVGVSALVTACGSGGAGANAGGAGATIGVIAGSGGGATGGVAGAAPSAGGAGSPGVGGAHLTAGTGAGGMSAGTLAAGGMQAGDAAGVGGAAGGRGGRSGRGGATSGSGGASAAGASGATNAAGASAAGGAGDITVPAGYTLVWHDEFDVDGPPDPKNWKFESGFVRNEEEQWYQSANASVANGVLVIEARQERVANPNYQAGSSDWKTSRQYAEYTSSSMTTSGLQSFEYGRFELRARIPTASGMWPAWWTLGVKGEWPSNGEIDIMEYYQNKVLANVACGTSTEWQAKWDSASKSLASLGANWSDDFHVWRMDWDDQNIELYLDDQTMNTSALSSMLNADGTSPFTQKAYMLVNLALGGQNGGSLDGTTFPQRYEVDYVRVFQKN